MIFHPEEYQAAQEYWKERSFPGLSSGQVVEIREKGKDLIKFHLRHRLTHHSINLFVLIILFGIDWWILLRLGAYIGNSAVLSGLLVGFLHGILMYSLAIFTLHEGAAHKLIVLTQGSVSRFFSMIVNNISRITLAESDYYARSHLSHHAHFTTPKDDEFLNFISARRFYGAFIPFASVFNFSDFKAHTGMHYTPSRFLSLFLTFLYHAIFALLMLKYFSWLMIFIALALVFPNVAFWIDRLRQYTEHNLMPLNTIDGARDLGMGFWGMLIGGGPWGQPCHWTHHLYPGIPWYNQLRLHAFIKKILTPEQRRSFLLKPIIGFPQTLLTIVKSTSL